MVLEFRQAVPDFPAIRESMPPAGYPKNTRPAYTPDTSRTTPLPSCPGCPGPRLNLDSKPQLLSPGLSAVQGPPPSRLPSVDLERAISTTREQQIFPAPIPKYVLGTINL